MNFTINCKMCNEYSKLIYENTRVYFYLKQLLIAARLNKSVDETKDLSRTKEGLILIKEKSDKLNDELEQFEHMISGELNGKNS